MEESSEVTPENQSNVAYEVSDVASALTSEGTETSEASDDSSLSVLSDMSGSEEEDERDDQAVIENIRKSLGPKATSIMRRAVDVAYEYADTDDGQSLLDDTIFTMRSSGMSHRKIAAELSTQGAKITEDEVADRLAVMYSKMEKVTTAEYRMLQVARLEQIINMCWNLASEGSSDHIESLIKVIERLNKMYELEKETTRIEVEVVTNAQAVMLMSIVSGILGVITSDPRITRAVPIEELQAITAKALDVAEKEIVDEDGNVLTITPK